MSPVLAYDFSFFFFIAMQKFSTPLPHQPNALPIFLLKYVLTLSGTEVRLEENIPSRFELPKSTLAESRGYPLPHSGFNRVPAPE